jgi:hypothetical protein
MKKIFTPVLALTMLASPLAAQESPMQMAERVNACDGREVLSARMTDSGKLAVSCADAQVQSTVSTQNNDNRLGVVGPLIGLGALAIGVAALAGGSSSSDTQ